jgi:hypothetical protein
MLTYSNHVITKIYIIYKSKKKLSSSYIKLLQLLDEILHQSPNYNTNKNVTAELAR